MLDGILKNFNLFVDGRGLAGNIEEINPPKLTIKMEEFRNGGMDAPIEVDIGMEKLELDYSLTNYDAGVLALFGLTSGQSKAITIRGALVSESGKESAVVINAFGVIKEVDKGSWKAGDKAALKQSVALRYYKETIDGVVIHEIDIPNMKRIVNGVDQLSQQRANLGM